MKLLELMVRNARFEVEQTSKRLVSEAESLSERMLDLVKKVQEPREDGRFSVLNRLGEVQGRGLDIDLLVAQLEMLREKEKALLELEAELKKGVE